MKILQCLNHFLPDRQAGTEIYVWALSRELQRAGHEVIVITPYFNEMKSREYVYDGLRVIQYAEPTRVDRLLLSGRKPAEGLKAFASVLEDLHPDIVHFHEYSPGNGIAVRHIETAHAMGTGTVMTMHLAAYSCRTGRLMYMGRELCDGIIRAGKCARCSLHNDLSNHLAAQLLHAASLPFYKMHINTNRWNNKLGTALGFPFFIEELKASLNRAAMALDGIISITSWYRRMLQDNGVPAEKIHFIPQGLPYSVTAEGVSREAVVSSLPGIAPDAGISVGEAPTASREGKPAKAEPAPNGRLLRLVFIGRIDPFKGVHLLLEAVAGLPPRALALDIYGKASDESYYRKCLTASENMPHVRWMGVRGQQELIPLLSSYDALVLPSTFSEMSPLVIQEAFEAGIPVIGSSVYGIAEQVKEGVNGLLFPFNDTKALQEQIRRLLESQDLLEHLKSNIRRPSSFAEVAARTEQVYRQILRMRVPENQTAKIPG